LPVIYFPEYHQFFLLGTASLHSDRHTHHRALRDTGQNIAALFVIFITVPL
jgi:hypothetical protein